MNFRRPNAESAPAPSQFDIVLPLNKSPEVFDVRIVDRKKISVIITSYNHERYIEQCLESILDQKGNFNLEVILGDDCSTDNTRKILSQYSEKYPGIITMLPQEANLGLTKNLKRCLENCRGDFIAVCEGDDFWTDPYKLNKQMNFLNEHTRSSMCFSALLLYYEEENRYVPHNDQVNLDKEFISTVDLIGRNYIGNFSCCMYRAEVVKRIPKTAFDLYMVDWMFNMLCGEQGDIGFIRDAMSVYRIHSRGAWSGQSAVRQFEELIKVIPDYNEFFNFKYEVEFQKLLDRVQIQLDAIKSNLKNSKIQ
jgi:glycosyltransferase involved in cell wall biosynthesis